MRLLRTLELEGEPLVETALPGAELLPPMCSRMEREPPAMEKTCNPGRITCNINYKAVPLRPKIMIAVPVSRVGEKRNSLSVLQFDEIRQINEN